MGRSSDTGGHRLVAVLAEPVQPFELGLVAEIFGGGPPEPGPWYEFRLCSPSGRPARTALGFTVDTPHGLEAVDEADTVVVLPPSQDTYDEALLAALRDAATRGARLVSICTGAFALAAAGLLDGRRATTHWRSADALAIRHPEVVVDPDVLYVDHGDVATSAGAAAGVDLCLHLIRTDHGAEIANRLARSLVVPPHREGGQAQFIEYPMVAPDREEVGIDEAMAWARANLVDPLTVDELAERAAMSPRTFARRFRGATGTTPHQWLLGERIQLAQRLLETSGRSVDGVAADAGFGTAANFRLHFRRVVGVSPGAYRTAFRRRGPGGQDGHGEAALANRPAGH